jgi:hypothetical protein
MTREIDEGKLRQLLDQGLSQREIARRSGVPRSTLQDHLKRMQAVEVHRGTPRIIPRSPPRPPQVGHIAELDAIKSDLLEVVHWWRTRKLQRVSPGPPRDTQRQTWHVDKRWIERVKEMAELEGVSQAEIVDRAFRQYFEGV